MRTELARPVEDKRREAATTCKAGAEDVRRMIGKATKRKADAETVKRSALTQEEDVRRAVGKIAKRKVDAEGPRTRGGSSEAQR